MKLLFICTPEEGHINPLLTTAAQIASEGKHQVTFSTLEHKRQRIEASGLAFMPAGAFTAEQQEQNTALNRVAFDATNSDKERVAASMVNQVDLVGSVMLLGLLQQLKGLPKEELPDVLVLDSWTVAGYEVAEVLQLPLVVVAPFPLSIALAMAGYSAYNLPSHVPMELPTGTAPATGIWRWLNPVLKRVNMLLLGQALSPSRTKLRALAGLPPSPMFDLLKPQPGVPRVLHLVGCSYELNERRELPSNWHVVGPLGLHSWGKAMDSLWTPKDESVQEFLSKAQGVDEAVVYVATGSMVVLRPQQVAAMAQAFHHLATQHGIRFIWSLKSASHHLLHDELQLRPITPGSSASGVVSPDGRILVEQWVNQQAVLRHPQVKLFITHGGLGSTHEGLAAGKPLLCMPFHGDQPTQACQIEAKGLGLQVSPVKLSAAALEKAVLTILNTPRFAETAAATGVRLMQEKGPEQVATLTSCFAEGS